MTIKELQYRQSWPLEQKIDHSLYVIDAFLARVGTRAYVSFSGGKDSTVLLDLVRVVNPKIPAVFVNTGNEWPEIVRFVHKLQERGYDITELHPKMTPREVWKKYGFPLISKESAHKLRYLKHKPDSVVAKVAVNDNSLYCIPKKWRFLANEKFDVSEQCCSILKENPAGCYGRTKHRAPIVGTMASESLARTTSYIKRGGCNTFGDNAKSTPLAIWKEEDIWGYIKSRNLQIADIYYKGASRTGCVGCGFGCQFKDDNRFEQLYELYPKYYEMIMGYENNGVKYRDAVRKVFEINGKKLPDVIIGKDFEDTYGKQ